MWQPGEVIVLRGVYQGWIWYVQTSFVVKDSPEEVVLAVIPGAQCVGPEGYLNGKPGDKTGWDRWGELKQNEPVLRQFTWQTNRFLFILEPEKYFATIYIWKDATDEFACYYVNFQVPFRRTDCGFDTFDLELDIIINPDGTWEWKDAEAYERGIASGIISKNWVDEIEAGKREVFERLANRQYPLDGSWLNWKPNSEWISPRLPDGWDQV